MKMLRNLSEKLGAKFPSTTLGYSTVRIAHLDDAFSGMFELKASPVKGQSLPQKIRKGEKGRAKKIKKLKSLKTQVTILSKNLQSFA